MKKEIIRGDKRVVSQHFWVRTPTALVLKNKITPEEYKHLERIEGRYSDGSGFIMDLTK